MVKYNKHLVSLDYRSYYALLDAASTLRSILKKPSDEHSLFCYTSDDVTCISLDTIETLSFFMSDYRKFLEK